MREILFRGQSTDSRKWYEGDLYQSRLKSVFHISYYTEHGNRFSVNVIPETVGQFTGLYDCKGKRVFEGDILVYRSRTQHHKKGTLGVMKYGAINCSCCDGVYGWYMENGDVRELDDRPENTVDIGYDLGWEVIGNIHDNPEILD